MKIARKAYVIQGGVGLSYPVWNNAVIIITTLQVVVQIFRNRLQGCIYISIVRMTGWLLATPPCIP